MPSSKRTKKGNVTAKAREKHGEKYPVFDHRSCMSAVKLRHHGKGISPRQVLAKAASWARRNKDQRCLAAVKHARERDKEK